MNYLEQRKEKNGIVEHGNVLNGDAFLNHRMGIACFGAKEFGGRTMSADNTLRTPAVILHP